MEAPRILAVEDEADIRSLVALALRAEGWAVEEAATGEAALASAAREPPDLVVLDLMLPGLDGLAVCRRLRASAKTRQVPILMLTARGEEADIVAGLDSGADDYVVKPFVPAVLAARVRSALRRAGRLGAPGDTRGEDDPWEFGGLSIHPSRHEASVDGKPAGLTATEFRMLLALARRPGRVFTRNQLLDALHGTRRAVTDRSIDVQVAGLRRKLGREERRIETVRGVGYRFADE